MIHQTITLEIDVHADEVLLPLIAALRTVGESAAAAGCGVRLLADGEVIDS